MSNNDLPYTNADNIYFIVGLIDEYIDLVEELEEVKNRKSVDNLEGSNR